uniref:Glycolipid transfer protein domain-containing protein n=1 Tax=Anopheles melas TaxID=34690 RepID=A0A182UDC9_9DIPT
MSEESADNSAAAAVCEAKILFRQLKPFPKITDKYKQNETLFKYLEDLILNDKDGNDNPFDTVTDGLLWLKRAFEMMEQFFRNLLEDETRSEQVKPHLKKAYEECLLPYHGFLAQKAFQVAGVAEIESEDFQRNCHHQRKDGQRLLNSANVEELWPKVPVLDKLWFLYDKRWNAHKLPV